MTDAINSHRTNDTLREALVATLVKRSGEMSPTEILDAVGRIGSINNLEQYEKLANILSSVDVPQRTG